VTQTAETVVTRKHDGKTTYMLTTNAAARLAADQLLRCATEQGIVNDPPKAEAGVRVQG
jgi:hypothetical protein